MSATLLANELTNLSTEAKRKNPELRTAAEKSLQELKSLPVTSEQQLAADLSRRPSFIEPFLIACGTRNARLAGSGVTCLQRLVISKGLATSRLQDALDALNACADLGLEVQLKVLQALPSLLQNYADDLKGDLLSGALQVCSALQSAKVPTVSGVASATLQQLVTAVFERVADEDDRADHIAATHEIPSADEPLYLRPAAYDAYRVFRDFVLAAENRKTKFVQFASLSRESSLELLWSCINANPQLIKSHSELGSVIRSNVLPLVTQALSEKLTFAVTVRSLRLLDIIIGQYIRQFPAECEVALGLALNALDADVAPLWKRAMIMEMLRSLFVETSHVIDAYMLFDMAKGGKPVVQDIMATFVRMSTEKPAVIGLGQQSTVPVGPLARDQAAQEISVEATGSVAGVISSALGVTEINVAGVSAQWSLPRTACLEQFDKADAPTIPETYLYALVLDCLNGLSDCLAKAVIPLTVQHERSRSKKSDGHGGNGGAPEQSAAGVDPATFATNSHRRLAPINPLELESHSAAGRVKAVAALVESCWPAVLATVSTFLNAALDDQYYRSLIKAYQRFVQVAGLLRLSTARDALMTTLGKAAVPPHVLNNLMVEPPKTPIAESPRVFSNPKSLLSVDSLVSPTSSDRDRRGPGEPLKPMLTTRNLLCLRALLNLAIALGPTLDTAFSVVLDTLRQADLVLSSSSPQQLVRQNSGGVQKQVDSPSVVQAFSNEISAVEAAASRLLESTGDYPNDAFLSVLETFCRLLHLKNPSPMPSPRPDQAPAKSPKSPMRSFSGLSFIGASTEMQLRDYKFAIPKIGRLASLNVSRFTSSDPAESGWNVFIDELINLASNNTIHREARRAATDVLCKVAAETVAEVMEEEVETRAMVQRRALAVLLRTIDSIYAEDGELTGADVDVQGYVVDSLRAILERCGESLVAGWNRTVAILSSVFERNGTPPRRQDDEVAHIDWEHISKDLVSVTLGRTAFAATQLICSDFLSAVPLAVMPALIELFHRFASQTDDLNISLTTITMAWNVSDFLLNSISSDELHQMATRAKEAEDVVAEVESAVRNSAAAQWLLLLFRIKDIIGLGQKEVRKAAFQTLCSIFKNHGDQLTPRTWDLTLRSILFKVAADDASSYLIEDDDKDNSHAPKDEAISSAIAIGLSEIIAQYLRLIEEVTPLPSLWETFLSRLEAYLDVQHHTLNTAVYQAIQRVVSQIDAGSRTWSGPMYRTLHLWLKRNPAETEVTSSESNQAAFVAYVDAGSELYRLTQQSMSTGQIRTLVENLYLVIRHSDGPRYGADVRSMSQLQEKVLELVKSVRSDVPSTLVTVAAKFAVLHHETGSEDTSSQKPSFIAISSSAIDWLQDLVQNNAYDSDLLEDGGLVNAVQSLRHLVEQKYLFNLECQGSSLWQKATRVSLALSQDLLKSCESNSVDPAIKNAMWREYVGIVGGIVGAQGLNPSEDKLKIYEDEQADIESFKQLRPVLIPRLGNSHLENDVRAAYVRALFNASLIHLVESEEYARMQITPLKALDEIRRGRVRKAPCSDREDMCYVCLSELVTLTSQSDGTVESKRLAQAAAPLLVLRLAIPIQAYIADQPLRGRKPQPLSELEELLKCFEIIGELRCEPDALALDLNNARWTGPQAHLHYLYPLLVKAMAIASDVYSGTEEVLKPLQAVFEATTTIIVI